MIHTKIDYEARKDLCAELITADGKPGVISGARSGFATVTVLPDGPSAVFSWATVARMVADGREFRF